MKLYKTKKDPELYYYYNAQKQKKWMYRHRYYDDLGYRREKSKQNFEKEADAYRELLKIKTDTANGLVKQVEYSGILISEWLDIWYETNQNEWEIPTRMHRKRVITLHLKPLLGKYKLADLDNATYRRVFINKTLKSFKPSTVAEYHRLFKIAVNAAIDNEIISRNRFKKIKIDQDEPENNFLTPDELSEFLSYTKKYERITIYTLTLLLAYTGFRKGEALGLTWNDINFKNKTITVNCTRDQHGVRSPKTKRSYRTIHVDQLVLVQLESYKLWSKKVKLSFGDHLKKEDFIFISTKGAPLYHNNINTRFRRILKKNPDFTVITPHGLRHTHATILISKRIPVRTIADRLGNTPQMIYDVYGHSFEALELESVNAFSDSLKEVGGTSGGGF
ncbi:tyrosine-type recombinase/integrase [Bacillus sp. FSL K6-3431]|uniref:tyrosine-type recombinase/integrase n=1 Tax=Bacillus sp. FSL K6-3431 TaxID=2921500 RepID=UPI0030FA2F3B